MVHNGQYEHTSNNYTEHGCSVLFVECIVLNSTQSQTTLITLPHKKITSLPGHLLVILLIWFIGARKPVRKDRADKQGTHAGWIQNTCRIAAGGELINPSSPHDACKHHFTFLKTDLILLKLSCFRRKISMKLVEIHGNFLIFFTHFKSSSSTTSRELRQQFAACSGWRWQW